jgi:diacylglycerol kinase family enzyme
MKPNQILPEPNQEVLIAVNPRAGSGRRGEEVRRLVQLLESQRLPARVLTDLSEVAETAERSHERGRLRALVGVGGDGTMAELANRTSPGVPLAILPQGTENLLAKYVGIGGDAEALCRTIVAGHTVRLDAGRANGRLFLLMASCGFDAEVVQRLHEARRGNIHHWDYAKPILDAVRSYEYPELRISYEDEIQPPQDCKSLAARWAFVFNLPCYARGLPLAPLASGTDGLFDLCVFREGSLWHGMRYLTAVALGMHDELPDCRTARPRSLKIESEGNVPYQLDGDPGGMLPLEIEMLRERITLIVPERHRSREGKE